MKQVLPLLSLVALLHGNALGPSIEFINFKTPKIINGGNAAPGEWKWQASLQNCLFGFLCSHTCGAVLIDANTIVTAAHCVNDQNVNNYRVILGEHNTGSNSGSEQTMRVARLVKHEHYDENTIQNDIAILKLQSNVVLSPDVQPVALPASNANFLGAECWITGWGKTDGASDNLPSILQEVQVSVISNADCKLEPIFNTYVKDHMVCLEGYNKDAGACNGDSGGPMTCKVGGSWVLGGVTSWGLSNCPLGSYSVYTRISSFLSWISANRN